MREPTIAWCPGTVPAATAYDGITSTMDVLPTFAALAGTAAPTDRAIDGHDISAILKGDTQRASPYEALFYYRGYRLGAVRSGQWKLHVSGELYDLEADIGESTDVASDNPDIVERLEGLLDKARSELGDGPIWPVDPGIQLPPTARPIGRVENPKLLIPRHGKTGDAAHEPPIQDKQLPPPPKGWKRPDNW
jgi:arylsulfatase A-like enzyme